LTQLDSTLALVATSAEKLYQTLMNRFGMNNKEVGASRVTPPEELRRNHTNGLFMASYTPPACRVLEFKLTNDIIHLPPTEITLLSIACQPSRISSYKIGALV
jgi:hypothetical protein